MVYYVYEEIIPKALPPDLQRKRRRERRRALKGGKKGDPVKSTDGLKREEE
jgi:hypothetical protein